MKKQFKVLRPEGRAVIVTADYFVVEQGNLTFRNQWVGPNYPRTVCVFAFQHWTFVKEITS